MKRLFSVVMVCLLCLSMFTIFTPKASALNSRVGYWKFDEGTGSIAYDSSGMKNNGSITGAEYVPGIAGSALRFRNSTTYVKMERFPYGLEGNKEFTVSLWTKIDTWPTGEVPSMQYSYLICFGTGLTDQAFHILLNNDPPWSPYGTVRANFWHRVVPTVHTFSTGIWYNWVFVYNKTSVKMYQNGTFLEEVGLGGASPNLDPSGVFYFSIPGNQWFMGALDEIAIHDYARTPEEILDDYRRFAFGTHDIAVVDVHSMKKDCSPKPTVCKGMTTDAYVTVENQGDYTETFNVTAYANTTAIGKQTVTLDSKQNTTLTFTWMTTGLTEYMNYTMSATADTVAGETDTTDNTLSDGTVTVTHMGDVTGDGKCDIQDLSRVSGAFGSLRVNDPKDPQYGKYRHPVACPTCPHQPNTDLTGDSKVDIQDLARTSGNFGWHN